MRGIPHDAPHLFCAQHAAAQFQIARIQRAVHSAYQSPDFRLAQHDTACYVHIRYRHLARCSACQGSALAAYARDVRNQGQVLHAGSIQ